MRQVWNYEDWKDIKIGEMRDQFMLRSRHSPDFGKLSVVDLCCLTSEQDTPVGLYVFSRENEILYVGKTHGRSLHERAISHIDHRKPNPGSPHLAQFVSTLVKRGEASSEAEAVAHILNMKMTWLPIPKNTASFSLDSTGHKFIIAMIERRLLWKSCLNPRFNSPRVKKNDVFTMRGSRYRLDPEILAGDLAANAIR
jgi:hypothetical protein